jgi:orotidine-5'-phosphate decarboxylase
LVRVFACCYKPATPLEEREETAVLSFANPVFIAVDRPDLEGAESLLRSVAPFVGGIKLGLEFFFARGPEGIRRMGRLGLPIFLDAKLHDIPNTVAGAMRGIVELPVAMVTLHAAGGLEMMKTAVAIADASEARPWVLAVTVLTSLDRADLEATGQLGSATEQALRLGELALRAGCHGIVCSPLEVAAMRTAFGTAPKLVVPGVRPKAGGDDQKRTLDPVETMAAGADRLVIGRPITAAADPAAAARAIALGLEAA